MRKSTKLLGLFFVLVGLAIAAYGYVTLPSVAIMSGLGLPALILGFAIMMLGVVVPFTIYSNEIGILDFNSKER